MKTRVLRFFFVFTASALIVFPLMGQRASTDHNSSRSNNTAQVLGPGPQWSFGFFTGAATGLKSSENNLFRGQGFTGRLSGDYFFGILGLGLSSGFASGEMNLEQINAFWLEKRLPQGRIDIRSNPFNAYLLGGPSLRIGRNLQLIASMKGGLFYNQVGRLSIGHEGAIGTFYGFESGEKPWQFGISGGLSLSYNLGLGTSLMLSSELMHTNTQVQVLDLTQGIDIPMVENRPSRVVTAGFTLVKRFGMGGDNSITRNPSSYGADSPGSRRVLPTVNKVEEEIGVDESGLNLATRHRNNHGYVVGDISTPNSSNSSTTGQYEPETQSLLPPQHQVAIKTKGTGAEPVRIAQEPCGPVSNRTTYPDGTVEEITFNCPEDAASYTRSINGGMPNRISMNVSVPKQTQGATFGERVNAGLQNPGNAVAQGTGMHIIAGRLVRSSAASNVGVITNAGEGAASAPDAAAGRDANPDGQSPFVYGPTVNLFARDASSGMVSGRRSRESGSGMATGRRQHEPLHARESGSGMASGRRGYDYYQSRDHSSGLPTGRRQFQPVFFDGQDQNDVCNPCLVTISSPLYSGSGSIQNPLYESGNRSMAGPDNDCDGITSGLEISLIDEATGSIVATTRTNNCGDYWFANVPQGAYRVQVYGEVSTEKIFPVTVSGQQGMDIAVQALIPQEQWQHIVYSDQSGGSGAGKATFKDFTLVLTDDDGDGLAERYRATGRLTDGTTRDVTGDAYRSSGGGKASMQDFHFSMLGAGNQAARGGKASMSDLHFKSTGNGFRAIATFSDGNEQDVSEYVELQQAHGVQQIHFSVLDTDGDGATDLIWSPRSNFGASAQIAKVNLSDITITKRTDSHSFNLNVAAGDLDGDGSAELLVGNIGSGENLRPGNPIRGIIVKGGRNPGGDIIVSGRTNDLGEVELPGLEPGDYQLTVETTYRIADEVIVDFRDMDSDGDGVSDQFTKTVLQPSQNSQSLRLGDHGSMLSDSWAFNQNSSRSNYTRQIENTTAENPGTHLVRWSPPETLWNEIGSILSYLDVLDQELERDEASGRTGINTSRSNIKNYLHVVEDLSSDIVRRDPSACEQRALEMNMQFLALQQSLHALGPRYQTLSNILKTKHDTVKNSIQNVR